MTVRHLHKIIKSAWNLLTNFVRHAIIIPELAHANFDAYFRIANHKETEVAFMTLYTAEEGKEYKVKEIATNDEELNAFLFSLGCYAGEPITVISRLKGGCVVSVKDGRYHFDRPLAEAIALI